MHIDYYFAVVSPWVYLAGDRLERIAAAHGASIRYVPLDAAALFPRTGGQVLAERHESRKAYRLQELARHPDFTLANPNRARSLVGAFAVNQRAFHRVDGGGYRFVCCRCLREL